VEKATKSQSRVAREALAVSTYALVSVLSLIRILVSPGVISYLFDWDVPPFSQQFATALSTRTFSWNPYVIMGTPYTVGNDTFYYFFLRALAPLGGAEISKLMLVFVFSLSGYGMYFLCRQLKISSLISWGSGLLYMLSPFVYLELLAGHLPSVFSYAVAPIYLSSLVGALKAPQLKRILLSGLILAIGWTYIDFVIILPLVSLALLLAWKGPLKVKSKIFFGSGLEAVGLHSFWILPLINDLFSGNIILRTPGEASRLFIRLSVVYGSSSPLTNTFRLKAFFLSDDPSSWPLFWAGPMAWLAFSFLIPLIAFSALLFRRDRMTLSLSILALGGVILSSGVTVLGSSYSWLILNVPYFDIFTAVHRWLPVAIIPYSILVGLTFDRIGAISEPLFKYIPARANASISKAEHGVSFLLSVRGNRRKGLGLIFSATILLSIVAGFSGSFFMFPPRLLEGRLHTYTFNQGEPQIYQLLAGTQGDFRIANYPLLGDLGLPGQPSAGADPLGVYPPKSAIQFGGGFSSISDPAAYTRFLSLTSYLSKTSDIDKLLGLANVRYIVYYQNRTDVIQNQLYTPWYPGQQSALLRNFFANQTGLTEVANNGNIIVYESKAYTPHIYGVNNMDILTGDRSALLALAKLDNYSISDSALVFSGQIPYGDATNTFNLARGVFVIDGDFMDLVLPFLSNEYLINPGFYSTQSSWLSIDNEWWGKWRFSSSENFGDGLFTRNPNNAVNISFDAKQGALYDVWAKLYYDPSSFSTKFTLDGTTLSQVNTYLPSDMGFQWTPIGSTQLGEGRHVIRVTNGNIGTTSLLQLLVVPHNILSSAQANINQLTRDKTMIFLTKPLATTAELFSSTQLLRSIYFIPGADRTSKLSYNYSFVDNSFKLRATFNQTGSVNEAVLGHVDLGSAYSLAEMQSLDLTLRLSNPSLQFFEIKFNLDTTGSGVADKVIPILNSPANLTPNLDSNLSFNLASLAQTYGLNADKTRLIGFQVVFQKTSGTDLSNPSQTVTFEIRNLNIVKNKQQFDPSASYGNAIIGNARTSLTIQNSGIFQLMVRMKVGSNSNVTLSDNGTPIAEKVVLPTNGYKWISFSQSYLGSGEHEIAVDSAGTSAIDLVMIESSPLVDQKFTNPLLTFTTIDPTQYKITTDRTTPIFVVFMENYDPSWTISVTNSLHLRAYGLSNLYYIPVPPLHITLSYARQFLFSIGSRLSELVWGLLALAFVIPTRSWNRMTKKVRLRRRNGRLVNRRIRSTNVTKFAWLAEES
jgi:hypothetical protein